MQIYGIFPRRLGIAINLTCSRSHLPWKANLRNNFDMKRKTVLLLNSHLDVIGREIITTFLGIVVKREKILYNRAVKYRR